ncbi:MAG: protein kinase domain-containing protein [Aridibacter sp.]
MTDEFIGKILAGKYEIEEILRESDMGRVYRGKHLLMEKPVTIKILSPTLAVDENIVEQFSVEARTISRLSHPNILNVTDFGKDDETVFIVMENLEGENIKEIIKREGAFDVERAVRLTRQVAAALSSAHAAGIVHRNLTSEKILVTRMANDVELVKVLDIGSFDATEEKDFEELDSLDDLAYLSPEQCSEESESDERSDVYSLGIIFYEMLTGEVPFMADTATDLMLKHSQVPPPPLAAFREDIPEEVEPIVIQALAKNPDMRYQSAAAFADDLSNAVKVSDDDDTVIIPKVNTATAGANNNLWKTAFILLAGIGIMAFGMIYLTNMKQTDPDTEYKVDANGKPVQPLNPATGFNEKGVFSMADYPDPTLNPEGAEILPPDVGIGGGDGFDPWRNGGFPPGGAPPTTAIGPGGEIITIPGGESGNPFDPDEAIYDSKGRRIYLIPQPTDSPQTKEPVNPEKSPATVKPTPEATTDAEKKPETKPADKLPVKETKTKTPPAEKPKEKPAQPSTGNNKEQSGVEQNTL